LAKRIANGTYSGGTFINGTELYSPKIYATQFNVNPESTSARTGGFNIYGYYGSTLRKVFSINYNLGDAPYITFSAGTFGAYVDWDIEMTEVSGDMRFGGTVDLRNATVLGLPSSVATFG